MFDGLIKIAYPESMGDFGPNRHIKPPTNLSKLLSFAKRNKKPFAIGGAGVAGLTGLGYYLSKRKKQEEVPATAI